MVFTASPLSLPKKPLRPVPDAALHPFPGVAGGKSSQFCRKQNAHESRALQWFWPRRHKQSLYRVPCDYPARGIGENRMKGLAVLVIHGIMTA